jgi:RNA polymerase sigma-70 factor (ECF subfamily)
MQPEREERLNQEMARFRAYLETLACVHIDARLRAAFSFSDVVQETLVGAFKAINDLRRMDEAGQRQYLRTMLLNRLRDLIRHALARARGRHLQRSLEAAAERSSLRLADALALEGSTPDARLIREEGEAALLDALSRLPEREREAIVLQKFQGWKLDEIAAHLGCTAGAVAGLHARGLRRLAQLLGNRRDQPHD